MSQAGQAECLGVRRDQVTDIHTRQHYPQPRYTELVLAITREKPNTARESVMAPS